MKIKIIAKKYYSWTFTNILFWVFVGINIILAITAINPIETAS